MTYLYQKDLAIVVTIFYYTACHGCSIFYMFRKNSRKYVMIIMRSCSKVLYRWQMWYDNVIDVVLLLLLLTLNKFHTLLWCFHCRLWTNKHRLGKFWVTNWIKTELHWINFRLFFKDSQFSLNKLLARLILSTFINYHLRTIIFGVTSTLS